MVTHNMRDAIAHGNRLIMMNNGQVVLNISGEEKKNLTVEDLLMKFEEVSGENLLLIRLCLDRHIYIIITKICSSIHELQFFVIYFLYEFSHRLNHISLDKALYDQILLYRLHTVFHTDTLTV